MMENKINTIDLEEIKKLNIADDEIICLYENVSRFIYDNELKYDYEYISSGIGENRFDFTLKIKKNQKLPDKLLNMFFIGLDIKYKVTCKPLPEQLQTKKHDYYTFKIEYY
jgi:hypothetical protein